MLKKSQCQISFLRLSELMLQKLGCFLVGFFVGFLGFGGCFGLVGVLFYFFFVLKKD